MRTTSALLFTSLGLLNIVLSGCSTSNTTVPEGSQVIETGPAAPAYKGAQIVHADLKERIATIRNGESVATGFLICTRKDNTQTAILKAHSKQFNSLTTADILEGTPSINDRVTQASPAESKRLTALYHDAESNNN